MPARPEAFALEVVDQARRRALPASMIDDALLDRVRQVELFKRVPAARTSDQGLAELRRQSGLGGDDAAARRRRSAQALTLALGARCHAVVDEDERRRRLAALSAPVARAPAAAQPEIARLGATLVESELVRVTCERRQAAMWLRHEDHRRIVDVYPLGAAAITIAVDKPSSLASDGDDALAKESNRHVQHDGPIVEPARPEPGFLERSDSPYFAIDAEGLIPRRFRASAIAFSARGFKIE